MPVVLRHRSNGAVPVKDEADLDPRGGPGGGSIKQASARKFPESPVGRTAIYGFVLCLAAGIGVAHILETVEPVTTVRQGSPFTAKHAVRARGHMQSICDMGTRTVGGHANEVLAVEYILRKLREVERMAAPGALVEIASHTSSGAFNMDFIDGATNVYENVTNILCRISPKDSPESRANAVLVNAHFDSALASPGAVDDVIMVGLMLELASHLAEDTQRLNGGSIVLIFNGAEETNWQAAHGFITSPSPLVQEGATPLEEPRDWRKTLRCVLNLEAIGSGGRELLVRTGRGAGWISRLYAAVVNRPRATVIAQEVFDSGIFPGQTDFVVFRDEGQIPGLDVVIVENGYGYHSPHDRPDSITDGDIQRAGTTAFDVAGALLGAVAKGEHRAIGDGEAVFFDFLGLFMVWYPAWVGQLLNGAAVAIALVRIKDTWTSLGEELVIAAVKKELASMLCGVICPVAFGLIIIVVNPLAFYSNFYLTIMLYGPASLLGSLLYRSSRTRRQFDAETEHQLAHVGSLAISAFLLAALTMSGVMSAYILLLPLAANLLAGGGKCTPLNVTFYFVLSSFPVACWYQIMHTTLAIFQPVMGRSGMKMPPDVFISAVVGIITSIAMVPVLAPLPSMKSLKSLVLVALVWVAMVFRAYGSRYPYTVERPKKMIVQHVNRILAASQESTDSGLWINGFDWRRLSDVQRLGVDKFDQAVAWPACVGPVSKTGYCDMPWYFPLRDVILGGWYIDFPAFEPPEGLAFSVMQSESVVQVPGTRQVHLSLGGPSHMAVVFKDPEKRISAWSLVKEIGHSGGKRRIDGHVFVFFSSGGKPCSRRREWNFWIEISGDEKIETLAYAHYLNWGEEGFVNVDGCRSTAALSWLRDSLPEDYEPICWSSAVETRLL